MRTSGCGFATTTCVALIASALFPLAAAAQEPQLNEVVVTAQKITQRLQDVPSSLQVIGSETMHDADVSQISDVVMLTTGLDYSQSFGRETTNAVIRGVAAQFLADPTVVTFTDGFTLGFTARVNNSLLTDLERIEVLKGPQATLYGFDALGGVINYITKKPTMTPEASFSTEYGVNDTPHTLSSAYKVTASASGPLWASEGLYGRVAVATRGSDGTVDNLFDGARNVNPEHDIGARGSLRWLPTDNLEFNANASYTRTYDGCGDCSHIPPGWNFLAPNRLLVGQGLYNWNDNSRTTNESYLGGYYTTYEDFVLNATYTQRLFTITSITGYGYSDVNLYGDSNGPKVTSFGGTPGYFIPAGIHAESEELRIASNEHGRLTYLAGLYAYHSSSTSDLVFGPFSLGRTWSSLSNYAAFANLDYALFSQLSLSAGVRYDENRRRLFGTSSFGAPTTQNTTAHTILPRYSVTYKPNEQMNLYATVSKGYHAGGFNGGVGAPSPTYQPEYIWNYEIGLKGTFWNNRIQTQVDAFYIDWMHQQLQSMINLPGLPGVSFTSNAGKSRITGEELAVQWAVSKSFNLDASLTFLDSKYQTFTDLVIAPTFGLNPDLKGNRLPFSPRATASLSMQYVAPLPLTEGAWKMRLRADLRYTDTRFFDATNLIQADPYALANLYAGVQNDHLEIGVYADNVFNKGYLTGGTLPDAVFPPEVTLGDPRQIGVRFSAHLY